MKIVVISADWLYLLVNLCCFLLLLLLALSCLYIAKPSLRRYLCQSSELCFSKLVIIWTIHADFVVFSERRALNNAFRLRDLPVSVCATVQQCHTLTSETY